MTRSIFNIAVSALVFCSAGGVAAQAADTSITRVQEIARFEDARALAIDPAGRVYVIDAGRSVVLRMTDAGQIIDRLGGPGSGDYEFDDPRDIDPTNGLIIQVADAGNERIQRFSGELHFLETTTLDEDTGGSTRSGGRTGFRMRDANPLNLSTGRPIAVASANTGEIFAVDETRNEVAKWSSARRLERRFGGYDGGEGALVDPVGVAVDREGTVYVADRGLASIVVYDSFGSFIRMLAPGRLAELQRVRVHQNRVFAVTLRRLAVYDLFGMMVRSYELDFGEDVVDVAVWNNQLYLLTQNRLVRANP